MSECEDLTGDELQECQEDRARRKQYEDAVGHKLLNHVMDKLLSGDATGAAEGVAARAGAGALGEVAEALPEAAALALASGGRADAAKRAVYAVALKRFRNIAAHVQKRLSVSGEDARHHAGRAKRKAGGGIERQPYSIARDARVQPT